jgi:hypothetical protein
MKFLLSLVLAVTALTSLTTAQTTGVAFPEFDAAKWYNTAPITLEDLQGKAVMIEYFATW